MSDRRRTWLRRGAVGLAAVGVAALVGGLALGRLLRPERMADWLEPRLSSVLKRDVSIGTARVGLIPLRVRLADIVVSDPTGLAPQFASVEELGLRVRLMPLLRRQVVVERIDLVRPSLDLRIGVDTVSNLPTFSDTVRVGGGAARPFSLDLQRVTVALGRLSYRSDVDSLDVLLDVLRTTSAVRRSEDGRWQLEGEAGGRLGLGGPRTPALSDVPLVASYDLEALADFSDVEVRGGSLGVEGVTFTLGGALRELRSPARSVDVDATIASLPVARLLDLLPDSVRARIGEAAGTLDARLAISGPFGEGAKPTVTGELSLAGGRVTAAAGQALLDDVEATVRLGDDGVVTPAVRGRMLGGPVAIDGVVRLGAERAATLAVQAGPDLSLLGSLVTLPEGTTVSGSLAADLALAIPLDAPSEASGEGEVTASAVRVVTPALGVPVAIPTGAFRLSGRRLTFAELPVALGPDVLLVTGAVSDVGSLLDPERTPYLEASVRGSRLDVTRLSARPPADTTYTYGRVAFAQLGSRRVAGVSSVEAAQRMGLERPDSLPLAGRIDIELDTLIDRRGRSEALRATVELGPRFLRVPEATFRRYGGRITTGLNLALGPQQAQPFTMRMRAEAVDAVAFLGSTTPLGRAVRGTMSGEVDFAGDLDGLLLPSPASLVGGGRFLLSDGSLSPTPLTERVASYVSLPALREPTIRAWSTPFTVEGGAFRLAEAVLQGAPGAPRVGGALGFDGRLDLTSAVELPRAGLDSATVRRLGGAAVVAQGALDRTDLTRALLRIGGSVTSPEVSVVLGDGPSLAATVREEATREIRDQVQDRRQELEQRASGALRDLIRRSVPSMARDSTSAPTPAGQPAPPASSGGSSPAPTGDAPVPDSVPPASTPAPDSLPPSA